MSTTQNKPNIIQLKRKAYSAIFLFILAIFLIFWFVSGTILYWEAWIYIITFLIYEIFQINSIIRNDPELMYQRLTVHEKESKQKKLIIFGGLNYGLMYILPAIDHRFGWSKMPLWLLIGGYGIISIGWIMNYNVLKINRWASRTIQVQEEQKVINTGLYGIVRHPFYLAGLIFSIGTPLTLGSYWGLIGAISWLVMLILRLLDEEKLLLRDLPGYEEYCKRVKYHLIPGIF